MANFTDVSVGIVNFGIGNVGSVQRYFYRLGCSASILGPNDDWSGQSIVVVPGVGHFDELMRRINRAGCFQKLHDVITTPSCTYLGICLGFQILAEGSQEGTEEGLGILPTVVRSFTESESGLKVPHMGWNFVQFQEQRLTDEFFYFVHSYYLDMDTPFKIGATEYGVDFCSAVRREGVVGLQFHPEKSGSNGIAFGRELLNVLQEEKNTCSPIVESQAR